MCNTLDIPEESEDKSTECESEDSYADDVNEQQCLPPNLEPYLAQLNNLAQHDLNFQNLLLMYLVTSLPGFGGMGQADNGHAQTSNQIRDLLVDMISSAVKSTPNEEETGFTVPVQSPVHAPIQLPVQPPVQPPIQPPIQPHFQAPIQPTFQLPIQPTYQLPLQPTHDIEALGNFPSSMMAMGYPAANLQYRSPAMGLYNSSMRDRGFGGNQPMYQYHGGWMPSQQNEWNGGEQTIAGFMHLGALQVQGGSNIRETKDEDANENEQVRPRINYESDLLNNSHSNSSPASINDSTLEGFLSDGESFDESSDGGSVSL